MATATKPLGKPIVATLAEQKDTTLLKAYASLTHRLHGTADGADSLRRQRDLVEAEILRRMGGAR